MKFSVLVITLNEEANLGRCLESVNHCDDIVILDSGSTDRTIEIAEKHGARVLTRTFDNYANQRNYGLKKVAYSNKWVLMLDADEEATSELLAEVDSLDEADATDVGLYRMRRKDYFLGKWIKHSSSYPLWFGRLINPARIQVEREINEEYHTDAGIVHLHNHILHYPFNKGFSAWLEKHNRYSTMEAELKFRQGNAKIYWSDFLKQDPLKRRKVLKSLIYAMPGRPLIVFVGLYLIKGGFLEGRSGLIYCLLKSFYEFMISCKLRELKRREEGAPV